MAERSPKYAHMFRSGIIGYLIFGGCGVHVPCLSTVFFYKYMEKYAPDDALELSVRFGKFFLLPATILFLIFFAVMSAAQILAFV